MVFHLEISVIVFICEKWGYVFLLTRYLALRSSNPSLSEVFEEDILKLLFHKGQENKNNLFALEMQQTITIQIHKQKMSKRKDWQIVTRVKEKLNPQMQPDQQTTSDSTLQSNQTAPPSQLV